jgi:uncharacterized protein
MNNDYEIIFCDVKEYLEKSGNNGSKLLTKFPFRRRSDHIYRVYIWVNRLLEKLRDTKIDKNALLLAALFHDIGYAISDNSKEHAENSVTIFEKKRKKMELMKENNDFVKYLIMNHSKKELMKNKDTPIELLILMEADLLDETGALSIVWDCMAEGAQEIQNFEKTYEHIKDKSCKILNTNPMITEPGKEIWKNKQRIVKEFCEQLYNDLYNQEITK